MTTAVPPPGTLIFLHGHDDDPEPAAALAREMAARAWNVVAPAGPVATGDGRRAWWRSDDDGAPDPSDVAAAVTVVDDLVDRYAAATPVVLGGFSQGGALALALGLADGHGLGLAGVFAVGAWLADLVGLTTDLAGVAARGTPVLIAHGADDDDVPLLLGRSAARLLDRHAIPVTFVQLDVGHVVAPFVPAIHEWVAAAAQGERPATPP